MTSDVDGFFLLYDYFVVVAHGGVAFEREHVLHVSRISRSFADVLEA
jgi:hypothetical protein